MENLQQRRSSLPDITETSSSLYSKEASNSSAGILETYSFEENEQENIVSDFQLPEIPKKTAETNPPSTNAEAITSLPSSSLRKKNSILQRSLSFLNRSEEKNSQPQLVKVHTFTIYDEEKDKFIEITEEEWKGDGPPPPRKSTDSQKQNALMIDKALPSLPELPTEKENSITKFNQWLKDRYPYIYKRRLPIIIFLIILFIALLIIIILAATGVFAKNNGKNGINNNPNTGKAPSDTGKPGLNMSGTGDGTYYDPGVGLGACGDQYTSSDFVCAMNAEQFGTDLNPNEAPICNMCIKVTGPKGTVKVKVVDKCPPCKYGDVDLSPAAFDVIGDEVQGRIPISWEGC